MKKQTQLFGVLITVCLAQHAFSQSTINGPGPAGHNALPFPALYYCGWDALTTIPFNLEHRGNQDINFLLNNVQRMTIKGSAATNPGFVGIGTIFANPLTPPRSLLHIHDGAFSYFQATNGTTGSGGGAGVKFGLFGCNC